MSSSITDYFSPKPKRSRMGRCDGDEWSEEEWFCGATQQYVEDRGYSGEALVEESMQQLENTGMEEFTLDNSFEEWTASFIGIGSLSCSGGKYAKEVENGDVKEEPSTGSVSDDGEDLYPAESLHSGDTSHLVVTNPDAGEARTEVVGDQDANRVTDESQMSLQDESPGPTADHAGVATDNRPESERRRMEINDDNETQRSEPTRVAFPLSNSPDMVGRGLCCGVLSNLNQLMFPPIYQLKT